MRRAARHLGIGFLLLTCWIAEAETLQVSGRLLVVGPGASGHAGTTDYLFHAELEGHSWKIVRSLAKPGGNGPERAELATDGNSFYQLLVFPPKEQAAVMDRLRLRGEARPGPWLGNCNTPEKMIWLAYCSSDYFSHNTSNSIPDLDRVNFRTAPPRPYTANFTQGRIRFLKELDVYAEVPSRSKDASEKAIMEFRVSEFKQLNGCNIPMHCSVTWYSVPREAGAKRDRGYTYEIIATNCITKPSLPSFLPPLEDKAWIVDYRFTNAQAPGPITYIETNHSWLTGKESPASEEVVRRSNRVVFSE